MCGILCICGPSEDKTVVQDMQEKFQQQLRNRGPDALETLENGHLTFVGSVLWQQGQETTPQPVHNDDWILLFNGDIFNAPSGKDSDTTWLFAVLNNCQTEEELLNIFKTTKGPYSFVIYRKTSRTLYFARDSLGRNSLLVGHHEGLFYISSVNGKGMRNNVMEVPPLGIYAYDLEDQKITLHRWTEDMLDIEYYQERIEEIDKFLLNGNIKLSLDGTSLNPLWLQSNPIENLSFRFDDLLKDQTETDSDPICNYLLTNAQVSQTVDTFIKFLSSSVKDRIRHCPKLCTNCPMDKLNCHHPKIGILFSGGVDCTLLAVLADKLISPAIAINLYNVAFEKVAKSNGPPKDPNWNVPDRLSAFEALEELKILNPDRNWNLVEINIPRKKVDEELLNTVSHLVYPLTSVLDESLGGALWFASGGSSDKLSADHCCRVLLIGSGADELLGGYTRHRNAFKRTGDVEEELLHDWHRLPSRNLARDDRVISDNGVTPRSPFVEENFVEFIRNLHPMQKCYHGLAEGLGDKLLLRLAAFRLGLQGTATRRKRALQFGSRIADSRQNAKDKGFVQL